MATNAISDKQYSSYRFSVEQYYRMAEVGLLAPDARTELIEGEICTMPPIGCRHSATVAWLHSQLAKVVGERAALFQQSPLRLSSRTEPLPDLMLLHSRRDHYSDAHPTARDTLLVVEVSDSTWMYDREIKVPLYAAYGVPEVWLVDLGIREFTCYRSPLGGSFMERITLPVTGKIVLPSLDVSVDLKRVFCFGDQSVS